MTRCSDLRRFRLYDRLPGTAEKLASAEALSEFNHARRQAEDAGKRQSNPLPRIACALRPSAQTAVVQKDKGRESVASPTNLTHQGAPSGIGCSKQPQNTQDSTCAPR